MEVHALALIFFSGDGCVPSKNTNDRISLFTTNLWKVKGDYDDLAAICISERKHAYVQTENEWKHNCVARFVLV